MAEISRWSSEARANTTGSHSHNERTPDGVPEAARRFPAHPPGRIAVVPEIRWYLLARLARPPANFHDASGVAKCMTGSSRHRRPTPLTSHTRHGRARSHAEKPTRQRALPAHSFTHGPRIHPARTREAHARLCPARGGDGEDGRARGFRDMHAGFLRVRCAAAARPARDLQDGADQRAALDAILAGRAPSPEQKPSIGCNIKWKPRNEPEYFFGR